MALALLKQGFKVGLEAGGAFFPPADGPGHAASLLKCLALVTPVSPGAVQGPGKIAFAKYATCFHVSAAASAPAISVTGLGAARRSA